MLKITELMYKDRNVKQWQVTDTIAQKVSKEGGTSLLRDYINFPVYSKQLSQYYSLSGTWKPCMVPS